MSAQANRYAGICNACQKRVPAMTGKVEKISQGRRSGWRCWCIPCFDRSEATSDRSSHEDRACGDTAYEDACAAACGPGL